MRILLAVLLLVLALEAEAARSAAAVREFRRAHPCPVTGLAAGACPGREVDHIIPLKCGGADRPANMQWLTVKAHKQKTKREAKRCRGGARK
ncbi:MAG: HNH endonuclease signature motif containing protein [Betaproteobacteria bacterium]